MQARAAPSSAAVTVTTAPSAPVTVVHLRAAERRVEWSGGVIDNEGMGKKSSKSACAAVG